jgi:hypothetical protein
MRLSSIRAIIRACSGSFDVLLVNTNPAGGISYDIAADSFGLSLSGFLSIAFTDVSINTITPYIYVTSGTTEGGGLLSQDTFPNTQFTASDSEFATSGIVTPVTIFGDFDGDGEVDINDYNAVR